MLVECRAKAVLERDRVLAKMVAVITSVAAILRSILFRTFHPPAAVECSVGCTFVLRRHLSECNREVAEKQVDRVSGGDDSSVTPQPEIQGQVYGVPLAAAVSQLLLPQALARVTQAGMCSRRSIPPKNPFGGHMLYLSEMLHIDDYTGYANPGGRGRSTSTPAPRRMLPRCLLPAVTDRFPR